MKLRVGRYKYRRRDRIQAGVILVYFTAMIVMGLLGELGVVNNVPPNVFTWILLIIGVASCILALLGRELLPRWFWLLLACGLGLAAWILRHRT